MQLIENLTVSFRYSFFSDSLVLRFRVSGPFLSDM